MYSTDLLYGRDFFTIFTAKNKNTRNHSRRFENQYHIVFIFGHNQLMLNIYSKRTFRNVLSALSGENSRYGVKIVKRLGWDGKEVVTGITANNPPTHKHGSISAPVVFGVLVAKGSSVFRVDVIKFIRRKTNGFDG